MQAIGYRHLRCFIEVARLMSVGQAAEALHVSQPAVSRTLRELEERLGARLFERAGRRLRLTEAGRLFQRHASVSLIELDRGVRAIAGAEAGRQRLALGVLPTVATRIMPRAALSFAASRPEVTLRISTGPNWLLLSQLREASLDLVVGRLAPPAEMAGLVFEMLYTEEVIGVVRPGHPLLADPAPGVAAYPLILPPGGAIIRPVVEQYFLSLGMPPPPAAVETVSLAVGRGIVRQSDAVWFISRGVVADELAAGVLEALDLGGLPMAGPVGLTLRAGQSPDATRQALMQALMQAVRDAAKADLG